MDEWAPDQYPPFKKFFYESLLPDLKSRGKCVIIITHDDQYFELADRIIKLSDRRIVSDVSRQQRSALGYQSPEDFERAYYQNIKEQKREKTLATGKERMRLLSNTRVH